MTTSDGDIFCDAFKNGIRTVWDTNVSLKINGSLNISAGENGAQAEGNSVISFAAASCIFDSGAGTYNTNGNATIDADGCGEIIENATPEQ